MTRDTIFALASAAGRAGVALMRISGPDAERCLLALAGRRVEPRVATLRQLRDQNDDLIDRALALWFPGPASFTGEDVVEFHVHGGPAVIDGLAAALQALGARAALPGEFSRRAFENDKLDLTQVEAVADLVDAETSGQRAQALRQLSGELSGLYNGWREEIIQIMALVEADIDFPDEADVGAGQLERARPRIEALHAALGEHLSDAARGERVRDGFRIALIGAPNAGKSTLFNRLVGREAAIVTPIAGTTRDVVEARLVRVGHVVRLSDTAGARQTDDPIEREGVRRARMTAEDADLRVAVLDGVARETPGPAPDDVFELLRPGDFVWMNKSDLTGGAKGPDPRLEALHVKHFRGSAETGDGVGALESAIDQAVTQALAPAEAPSLTRARHRDAVERAGAALQRALEERLAPELTGEDLRTAAQALGEITGRVDVEDILDRVFSDFCIGK